MEVHARLLRISLAQPTTSSIEESIYSFSQLLVEHKEITNRLETFIVTSLHL